MHSGDLSNLRAVILAAGLSSRMRGEVKALRPLGDTTMLGAALRAFSRAGVPDVRVATGHKNREVAEETLRHNGIPVYNPAFMRGMYSSVSAGLSNIEAERIYLKCPFEKTKREAPDGAGRDAVPERSALPAEEAVCNEQRPDIEAVFIMPVDAALVRAESIRAMAAAWRSLAPELRKRAVFIPSFGGRCGHPPLFGSDHIGPLIAWQGVGQWQDQWQWRGGLRHYLCSLLLDDIAARFHNGLSPYNAPLASAGLVPPLFDFAAETPREGLPSSSVFFLSLPDAGVVADMDTPEDLARAGAFLADTHSRRDPAPEEAWEWLRLSGLSAEKITHSVQVALGALRLGLAFQNSGFAVDSRLCVCGGLLHDVARNQKAHASAAADMLRCEGWNDCAAVVGAHTVLPDAMLEAFGLTVRDIPVGKSKIRPVPGAGGTFRPEVLHASACVYLCDKFWHGATPVGIKERFGRVKEYFAGNETALRNIGHRERIAQVMAAHIAVLVGEDAETVARTPAEHPLETWLTALLATPEAAKSGER